MSAIIVEQLIGEMKLQRARLEVDIYNIEKEAKGTKQDKSKIKQHIDFLKQLDNLYSIRSHMRYGMNEVQRVLSGMEKDRVTE